MKISLKNSGGLVPTYFLILLSVYIFNFNTILSNLSLTIFGIIGYLYSFKDLKYYKGIYVYFIILLFSGIISIIVNNNLLVGDLVRSILYIGLVLILLDSKGTIKYHGLLFYSLSGYFIIQIIKRIPPDYVLKSEYISRNFISIFILTAAIIFYISNHRAGKKIMFFPAIISFIISIYGYGRAGIISSAVLLVGIFLLKMRERVKNKYVRWFIIVSFIILIIIISIYADTNFQTVMGNFAKKGLSNSERIIIWKEYSYMSIKSFSQLILAPKLSDSYIMNMYNGNLHNSYLQMYASHGLIFFLLNIILLIRSLLYFFIENEYIMFLLLLVLLIRAFFDKMFFSGFSEILLLYFIFYPHYGKSKIINSN